MRNYLGITGLSALLAACTPTTGADPSASTTDTVKAGFAEAGDHAYNFGMAAKEGAYSVTDHIAGWMRPEVVKPPLPVKSSYCYHALQDILCYRAPMPGWEHRLVAYQGTDAPPPKPATMASLPLHKADASMLPTSRVTAAKPVFTKPPEEHKEAAKADDDPASLVPDASHEQLPDPSITPQL